MWDCPECGRAVSDSSRECWRCGYVNPLRQRLSGQVEMSEDWSANLNALERLFLAPMSEHLDGADPENQFVEFFMKMNPFEVERILMKGVRNARRVLSEPRFQATHDAAKAVFERAALSLRELQPRWDELQDYFSNKGVRDFQVGANSSESWIGASLGTIFGPIGTALGAYFGGMVAGEKNQQLVLQKLQQFSGLWEDLFDELQLDFQSHVTAAFVAAGGDPERIGS